MPFKNLNNDHLSDENKIIIKTALEMLDGALSAQMKTLTPKERMKYGSVNERKKLFVNKVWDLRNNQPGLSNPDVDWEEFEKDYESRHYLESILSLIDHLRIGIQNSKILHDWDNYHDSLSDYRYTKYKIANGIYGYETKGKELFQFFETPSRTPKNDSPLSDSSDPDTE